MLSELWPLISLKSQINLIFLKGVYLLVYLLSSKSNLIMILLTKDKKNIKFEKMN